LHRLAVLSLQNLAGDSGKVYFAMVSPMAMWGLLPREPPQVRLGEIEAGLPGIYDSAIALAALYPETEGNESSWFCDFAIEI
jgi:hypothetical protein